MNYRYKLLCFCSNFALGLTSPVLSLILLEHGCTMSTLGIAISIFSIIVITAELPTGIFADLYGRKLSFILSLVFSIVMMIVLFLSHQFFSIVICMILMGLATAFSSGSLDAMAIEDYAAVNGSATLSKGLSQFYFFQGAGLAIGALAGGIIPHSTGYQLHIVLKSIIVLITLLVGFSLPHDNPHPSAKPSLSLQLKTMKNALQHSLPLDIILLCMALIAISQTAVETYWQPMLQSVSNGGSLHTSGLLASGAYLAVTAGCALMEKASMNSSRKRWRVYLVLGFVEAGLIFALSYSKIGRAHV